MIAQYATTQCHRCRGRSDAREEHCPRCDDTGAEPFAHDPIDARPRAVVHAYAIERAEHRLRSCLRWLARGELDVDRVAGVLARLLSFELPAGRIVPGVQRWTGLDERGAHEVIEAYARALDEHARTVRCHARGRRESARGREQEAIARACEEHAGRVIAVVPWALAAE